MPEPRFTKARFDLLVAHLGGRVSDGAIVADLRVAYAEPARFYHTAEHLEHCLGELDDVCARFPLPEPARSELEAALWFHDAVYDPRRSDNEARSAAWATQALGALGVDRPTLTRIAALIAATALGAKLDGSIAPLLVDIDHAILGAPLARFERYDCQIRQEYAWVEDSLYRRRRRAILLEFLAAPCLYRTAALADRYEVPARENLQRAIDALAE